MRLQSDIPLAERPDTELQKWLKEISRNGDPDSGSAAALRKKEIQNILSERQRSVYRIKPDGSVTCGGQ